MPHILLDTCAVIWLSQGESIGDAAVTLLSDAAKAGTPTYISAISAWEVGLLVARQRLHLGMTPERWFSQMLGTPHVRLAELSPNLLIASSFLPGRAPRDPADRIIAATARDLGATLLTRDHALLDYGKQGHISAMAC